MGLCKGNSNKVAKASVRPSPQISSALKPHWSSCFYVCCWVLKNENKLKTKKHANEVMLGRPVEKPMLGAFVWQHPENLQWAKALAQNWTKFICFQHVLRQRTQPQKELLQPVYCLYTNKHLVFDIANRAMWRKFFPYYPRKVSK